MSLRYRLTRPRLRTALFALGVLIQLVALFGEHALEIPFLLQIVAPTYYHASNGVRRLESDSSVAISSAADEGFVEICSLLARHTAKKLSSNEIDDIRISDINVKGAEFVDSKIATSIHWSFTLAVPILHEGVLSDHGTDSWSFEAIKAEVDELKNPNILAFCLTMFMVGTVIDVIAFRMENAKDSDSIVSPVTSKPASRGRIKTSHSEVLNLYQFS
jgi:hypothetical protein